MKTSKLLTGIVAAAIGFSGFLGWTQWKQQRTKALAFEARQTTLAHREYVRLREQVIGIEPKEAESLPVQPPSGDLRGLLAENERLHARVVAHHRAATEAVEQEWREKIEAATARIRGLEFKEPVSYNELDRSEIGGVIEKLLSQHYTDEEFDAIVMGYAAMGLIPENYPLKQTYIDLMGEQIAAFYDQHTHRLFMFKGNTLTNAQNRVILSHELTHALQDQHFKLSSLPIDDKKNSDRAMAATALIEGDATLEMTLFMMEDLSGKGAMQTVSAMFMQNMEKLVAAPRILREGLLFPYLEGSKFCTALQMYGTGDGFDPINAAYKRVPSSSTQILHPEKYLAGEEPIPVEWASLEWKGAAPDYENVLGEYGTRILLSDWGQEQVVEAAKGWRGDRYLVFAKGDVLVWRSLWSNGEEAQEFASAALGMLGKRYGVEVQITEDGGELQTPQRAAMLHVERREGEVMLVHAPTIEECRELIAKFGSSASPSKPAAEPGVEAAAR